MRMALLVDATDLNLWAKRRDAQAILPKLIRRLVHATADRVIRAGFRAGEGISLSGWDGIVVVEAGNAYVPDGTSAWEMGTSAGPRQKADEDYEKRTNEPGEIDPLQTTFVFVTPRRWTGKSNWQSERSREGKWLEVKAYDADDLEEWLELASGVHIWFSTQLGKSPEGAVDVGTFWEDWSSASEPPISAALVLAGRATVVEQIHDWLHKESSTLAIRAESRDEALAVFAAACQKLNEEDQARFLSRAVAVQSLSAFQQLAIAENPIILMPLFDGGDAVGRATRAGHRVVVPLGAADGESDNTLKVSRLERHEVKKVLMDSGVDEEAAFHLAKLASRSLISFRRKIAVRPEVQQPLWAHPEQARDLVPALLAGGWAGENSGDRELVTALGGTTYESISSTLVRWANETDAPVRNIAGAWFLTAKEDTWSLLARFVTSDDLRRFEEVVLKALGTPDPRFELSKDKRYIANFIGKSAPYSGFLQKDLADTVAFLGARGESLTVTGGINLSLWCTGLVRRLLKLANEDWRIWASLSHLLPLLAEAAPDEFLAAVESGISGSEPVLLRVFAEQEDALFGRMPHTGLLWSLETIAWDGDHLSHAVSLLAELMERVPEGNPNSHLRDSLRGIFLLWLPQTGASLQRRLAVIDALRERAPDVSWWLLEQLLPKDHDAGRYNATPRWREWAPKSYREGPRPDYNDGVKEIIARVLADVGESGTRWPQVIWALPQLGVETFEKVSKELSDMELKKLNPSNRNGIWNGLRDFISRHRSFPDADWSLPAEYLHRLEPILARFEPEDLLVKYSWLFDHSPSLPEGLESDWHAREAEIEKARDGAVAEVHQRGGLELLLDLGTNVERPGDVGVSLGKVELDVQQENEFLRANLASTTAAHAELARGFVYGRFRAEGFPWASPKLVEEAKDWTPEQRAQFLVSLPFGSELWRIVEAFGADTDRAYWRLVNVYAVGEQNIEFGVRKFLAYDRPHAALELLSVHVIRKNEVPAPLIAEALERMIQRTERDDRPHRPLSHDLSRLLNMIATSDGVEESRIAQLEWIFLPVLGSFERRPKILYRELAKSPEFFVQLVSLCFRPEGEESKETTEDDRARARHAYNLLHSWRTIPGADDGSRVNCPVLKEWVEKARALLADARLLAVGDEILGQVLSGSPFDENGSWPHAAVCQLIDQCRSADLENGLEIGVYNSRGVVTKSPFDGGMLEREIADRYQRDADAKRDRWPRTAAMLRRIVEHYQSEAKFEDQNLELRQELE